MARAIEILLYVPNLIGYVRVLLLFATFWVMEKDYLLAIIFYSLSSLLDAFDGYYARKLNQSSKFGGLLDMLTDRVATTCLNMCLCSFYSSYMFYFQMWVFIDITSHWSHQLASIFRGENSHKSAADDKKRNIVLRYYYTSRPFLFFMCAMNEVFFCSLYLNHFDAPANLFSSALGGNGLWYWTAYISLPFMAVKTIISIVHLMDAAWSLACIESESSAENPNLRRLETEAEQLKEQQNNQQNEIFLHPNHTRVPRNESGSSTTTQNSIFHQKQKIYPDSNSLFDSRLLDTPTASPVGVQNSNSDESVRLRRKKLNLRESGDAK